MSFSVASSAARVRAPARVAASAPRAAARATSLAAAPSRGASSSSAAVVALSSKRAVVATGVVSPRASGAVATRATRASAMRVFAGRFETERTYIMIKPDGVQRGYVGEIIARFERKGNVLKGLKTFQCPKAVAEEHYQDLSEKPFFGDLVEYICSGPVVCMVWEGPGVVKSARKMIGATNPLESEPGTIRGDLAVEVGRNVIHGSDSNESAEREIALWFGGDDELVDWTPTITPWTRE